MIDFKHMHKSNRIEPARESWSDGWEPVDTLLELAAIALFSALMIVGMFYGLSELVIRGLIG